MDRKTLILGGFGAACWGGAYILMIWHGLAEQTYAVPFISICANLSWEFIFGFVRPLENRAQRAINIIWFMMDVLIAAAYLMYGAQEFTTLLPAAFFLPSFLLTTGICLALIYTSISEFGDTNGRYSAFIIDALMAMLFNAMLLWRGSIQGQSLYIAVLKLIGSSAYGAVFYRFYPRSRFLLVLFVLSFAFNLVYVVLYWWLATASGVDPLLRF